MFSGLVFVGYHCNTILSYRYSGPMLLVFSPLKPPSAPGYGYTQVCASTADEVAAGATYDDDMARRAGHYDLRRFRSSPDVRHSNREACQPSEAKKPSSVRLTSTRSAATLTLTSCQVPRDDGPSSLLDKLGKAQWTFRKNCCRSARLRQCSTGSSVPASWHGVGHEAQMASGARDIA